MLSGTFFAESEYEWDGQTRGGVTYKNKADGLGNYRIPMPMKTTLTGGKIPDNQVTVPVKTKALLA